MSLRWMQWVLKRRHIFIALLFWGDESITKERGPFAGNLRVLASAIHSIHTWTDCLVWRSIIMTMICSFLLAWINIYQQWLTLLSSDWTTKSDQIFTLMTDFRLHKPPGWKHQTALPIRDVTCPISFQTKIWQISLGVSWDLASHDLKTRSIDM